VRIGTEPASQIGVNRVSMNREIQFREARPSTNFIATAGVSSSQSLKSPRGPEEEPEVPMYAPVRNASDGGSIASGEGVGVGVAVTVDSAVGVGVESVDLVGVGVAVIVDSAVEVGVESVDLVGVGVAVIVGFAVEVGVESVDFGETDDVVAADSVVEVGTELVGLGDDEAVLAFDAEVAEVDDTGEADGVSRLVTERLFVCVVGDSGSFGEPYGVSRDDVVF